MCIRVLLTSTTVGLLDCWGAIIPASTIISMERPTRLKLTMLAINHHEQTNALDSKRWLDLIPFCGNATSTAGAHVPKFTSWRMQS